MDILKLFLKEKTLELNVSKKRLWFLTKKRKKEKRQKGKSFRGSKFKYLGFTFNKKGNYTDHIKEIGKKGRLAVNKVGDLKERIRKDDFLRRQMLFIYLVKNMIEYKVEIWRWEKKKVRENYDEYHIRQIFRIDFCTSRYLIKKKLEIDNLKVGQDIRMRKYEKKIKDEKRQIKIC